ncbi:MAG: hypothetical protein ACRD8Z_09240, partial [Nitrososphaeraceae archaeon]
MKIARTTSVRPEDAYVVMRDSNTAITRGEIAGQTGINLPIEPIDVLSSGLVYELESLLPELEFKHLLTDSELSYP